MKNHLIVFLAVIIGLIVGTFCSYAYFQMQNIKALALQNAQNHINLVEQLNQLLNKKIEQPIEKK